MIFLTTSLNFLLIEIHGFLKNQFKLKNFAISDEYFGTVTDGKFKLNVLLKSESSSFSFDVGSKLEIVGDLREEGLLNK